MLSTLGLTRAMIVQPSVYGTDNRATLAAIAASEGAFRGIAAVGPNVDDRTLAALDEAGIRGVRINPLYKAAASLADCPDLAARIKELGWHLQIFVDVSTLDSNALALLEGLAVPLVFDHMGYMPVEKGLENSGFRWLLARLASGQAWVKLSGAYYKGRDPGPHYADVAPFARALIEANPARCLWASNWPHPMNPKTMANDGDLLDLMADWAPELELQRRILVDNPAALYRFPTV
jgi:predicted TIM-barrel fold metal-dependent hydrolase